MHDKGLSFSFSFQASVHLEFTFIRTKGDKNSEIFKKKTKQRNWYMTHCG